MANEYLDEIEFNSKSKVKKKKSLISELDELDKEPVLVSDIMVKNHEEKKQKKEEKKAKKEKKIIEDDEDDWMTTLDNFKAPKIRKNSSKKFFDDFGNKKKKKKKKKGEFVSHKKEFETEMALLKNLQIDQNKFVDSLQKKYNQMENTKSTARGVGKYTTDLIMSINGARDLSMRLVDRIIATKKAIADLDFKERKEFGSAANSEQQNLSNYASTYLKQLMSAGRNNIVGSGDSYDSYDNIDDNTDDLFDSINESLGDTDRSEDVEKYLKYENDNVKIHVLYHDSVDTSDLNEKYDYIAINKDGKVVDDYPLPEKTKLQINRTTGFCKDIYGNSYEIDFD